MLYTQLLCKRTTYTCNILCIYYLIKFNSVKRPIICFHHVVRVDTPDLPFIQCSKHFVRILFTFYAFITRSLVDNIKSRKYVWQIVST